MLMLFSKIEEMALCILHLPCDFLKYVWFNDIYCEISESHFLLSILGYSPSYRWVMSEILEEGARVFNLHLSDRTRYFLLQGRVILNVICQELLDWPPT